MSFILDEYGLKPYIDAVVAVPRDAYQLKEYRKEMARAKRFILDGVRDHIVSHIASQGVVGYTFHVVPRHFQAEDVLGGEVEIHQDAERGTHKPLPHQNSRELGSVVSDWSSTSSYKASTIGTQQCL